MTKLFNDHFERVIEKAASENLTNFGFVKNQILKSQISLSDCINELEHIRDLLNLDFLSELVELRNEMTFAYRNVNKSYKKINDKLI